VFDLQSVCAQYGLDKHELSVLFLDLQAIYTEYGLEHDLLEQKKIVYWHSTYNLSVIIMA